MRTSKNELEGILETLNRRTQGDFSIGYAYGRPRLYRQHESVEVSPRLPRSQLYEWINAFLDGIDYVHTHGLTFANTVPILREHRQLLHRHS